MPADGEIDVPEKMDCEPVVGLVKFARLKTLKPSTRNCTLILSPIEVVLNSETSASRRFGPINAFFPTSPNVPILFRTKAFGLNHTTPAGLKMFGLTTFDALKPGAYDGRSDPVPELTAPDRLLPVMAEKGKPLKIVTIELTCQPLASLSTIRLALLRNGLFFPNGNSYPPENTNLCF